MNRVAIYFFWDKDGIVDNYNIYMLNDIKVNIDNLIVVSNGKLIEEGYNKFSKIADKIIERENKGFDVWAYKVGIENVGWDELRKYDELILFNFTNYGPVYPLKIMFEEMDQKELDFWGITEHYGYDYDPYGKCKYGYIPRHIQSSFIAVRKKMICSKDFYDYWDNMPEINDYTDSICYHEAIFTEDFTRKGYKSEVYVKTQDLKEFSDYPLMLYPVELIKNRKCPIFKRKTFYNLYEEFLDISCGQSALELYEYLKNKTDYDLNMIWDNLLRTANMSDIKERMQLNYVLPQDYAKKPLGSIKKVALFIHIFSEDMIEYCYNYARNMPDYADIFVSTDTESKREKIKNTFVKLRDKRVKVIIIPNRGRDVSALLIGFRPYYDQYDYICFAHDKKSKYDKPYMIGESFSYHCFENILATKNYVENVIDLFEANPRMGLAVPPTPCHGTYSAIIGLEWQGNYQNVLKYMKEWNMEIPIDSAKAPIAPIGTMFWFRSKAMEKLFAHNFKFEDFDLEPIMYRDGGFMHAIERLYPIAVQASGYYSCWIMSDKYAKMEITNLHKMFRDANQTLFWNFGADDRHKTLNNVSSMKDELELTKLALIKSWDDNEKVRNEVEKWKYPQTISLRFKMICRCIIGKKAYHFLISIRDRSRGKNERR